MPDSPSPAIKELSSPSDQSGTTLTITIPEDGAAFLSDASLGDSISINGTCLTITSLLPISREKRHHPTAFTVGVSPETLRRTNIGSLTSSSQVNLERACLAGTTRLGGHFVQGHVDTIANILSVTPDGEAFTFRLQPRERDVLKYVVEKGYITLDGASLTITAVNDHEGWFEIMLISYTQEKVVMGRKREGDAVNVEVDMVGKYVEKSVKAYLGGGEGSSRPLIEKIVEQKLEEARR